MTQVAERSMVHHEPGNKEKRRKFPRAGVIVDFLASLPDRIRIQPPAWLTKEIAKQEFKLEKGQSKFEEAKVKGGFKDSTRTSQNTP